MHATTPFPITGNTESRSGPEFTATRLVNDRDTVYVQAVGTNTTPGFHSFFYIGPELIFPPRLHFANIPPTGIVLQVVTPYQVGFAYKYPVGGINVPGIPGGAHTKVTVYTAKGTVDVPIIDEPLTKEFPKPAQ
jgi:hypothetical protein